MVFSSLLFAFFFLPIVVGIYYLSKQKYQNYILLIASLIFYGYGEPKFVFVMIGSILVNYFMAIFIMKAKEKGYESKNKVLLIIDLILNIGILFVYKYLDFAIGISNKWLGTSFAFKNIALPIGISFFTFQAMSYVIDVYRGDVEVQKNPFYLALYVSFFPQLVAGPIVRYSTVEDQILHRVHSMDMFAEGIKRFFLGFSKKVLLANNLSVVASNVFSLNYSITNPCLLWLGAICYSLQIFYDFSGYSDMAIGLGKMFGFTFEENFNYPYMAKSVTDFWRRWHISLSQWFRDYVYIPMGGNRCSWEKQLLNMFVVWLLTGIWHGANNTFIVWGLSYFVLLVIEKYIVKPEKRQNLFVRTIWRIFTLLMFNFLWVIFNSSGVYSGVKYCLGMLGYFHNPFTIDSNVIRYMREYGFFIIAGIIFTTPVAKKLKAKIGNTKIYHAIELITPLGYALIFLWGVSYIILGTHNPFIYFNF